MLGEGKGNAKGRISKDFDMRSGIVHNKAHKSASILFFLGMIAFKFAFDLGYIWLSSQDKISFPIQFSLCKYFFSTVICLICFFVIRHENHRASSFFLYFMFLFQIVPISTVYAMADKSTAYYSVLSISFVLCCLIVGNTYSDVKVSRSVILSKTVIAFFVLVAALIVSIIFMRYGMPSMKALDIFSVYEIRGSGSFRLGQYEKYLFTWTTAVILPVGIAWCVTKRRYCGMLIISGFMLALYLYSGHKTFLFSIPLVILCTWWAARPKFYVELFTVGCFCFFVLVVLLWLSPVARDLIQRIFSVLARRVLYVPANNKFHYYEYFSERPLMGLGGIFPRWLLYIPNYYESIPYTFEISEIFYGLPEMNSNTGFLAEGYMRFGHLGTVGIMLLFAWLLKMIDSFQSRTSYALAVGVFIYQIYTLADGYLLESMMLGPWMLLIVILLFCGVRKNVPPGNKFIKGNKMCI